MLPVAKSSKKFGLNSVRKNFDYSSDSLTNPPSSLPRSQTHLENLQKDPNKPYFPSIDSHHV
jgi:hypothetical protein